MTAHVIGAGLAGLAAALALTDAGQAVVVYEAGPQAGGRCRSYFDRELGCVVDNGNHLLLSGNRAAFAYLDRIGARQTIVLQEAPCFPFLDLSTGERWVIRPNLGRLPWWIFSDARRVPGTRAGDYLALLKLRCASPEATVAAALSPGILYRRLLEPLAIAALNTPPESGLARLLAAVVDETLAAGGGACRPGLPRESLSASLIEPALAALTASKAEVLLGRRVAALRISGERVTTLETTNDAVELGSTDAVVLATPPWAARDLLPGLTVPDEFQAILNIHFAVPPTEQARLGGSSFIGLIGGTAEWVFVKPGHVSVTISAANRLVDQQAATIASTIWPEIQTALGLNSGPLSFRVVKEKRATFAATATQDRKRPPARTPLANLVLAGDWTATGLPATIEGAIRSGHTAASLLLAETPCQAKA
jgi:hydroxysqualene dehydroxylase